MDNDEDMHEGCWTQTKATALQLCGMWSPAHWAEVAPLHFNENGFPCTSEINFFWIWPWSSFIPQWILILSLCNAVNQ